MTTSPVDMRSTQMQMQDQLVQSQTRDLGTLTKGGKSDAKKQEKLRESCEGFESIFIQKMWQQMRATLPKTNMLQGKDEQYWQSMYDQELAKSMSSAGGIGLADMMYEQLSRDLVSASRTTASAQQQGGGSGFTATAAPLLQQVQTATTQTASLSGTPAAQTAHAVQGAQGVQTAQASRTAGDMYSGTAPQPEAPNTPGQTSGQLANGQLANGQPANGQSAHGQPDNEHAGEQPTAPNSEASPIVQQFLAELRQRQVQQQGHEPTASAAQPSSPTAGQAAAQGITVAQHSVQQGPGGMARSQRAQLEASNKPAGNGVMPAMQAHPAQPMQPAQPAQRGSRLTPPAVPAVPAAAQPNVQGAFVPPAPEDGTNTPVPAVPQATVTQAQAAMQSSAPLAAQAQAMTAQATAPVTSAEQQPQVTNTTFTTNIPSRNRRTPRPRGPRLQSGQPVIRTLPTPAPASPITNNGVNAGQTVTGQAQPTPTSGASPQALAPQRAPYGAPAPQHEEG